MDVKKCIVVCLGVAMAALIIIAIAVPAAALYALLWGAS